MKRVGNIVVVVLAALAFAGPVWAQGSGAAMPEQQGLREGAQEAAEALVAERVDGQKSTAGRGSSQEEEEDPSGFRVFWADGVRMETNDGKFQVRLGGRIQYDWDWFGDDSEVDPFVPGPIEDGTEFRRAQIFVSGYMYEKIEFKAQWDIARNVVKDLYFGYRHPHFGVRFGHTKEPFGLEELTSDKYITFIERALPTIFDSSRNSGFLVHGNWDQFGYGVGIFRDTDSSGVGQNEPTIADTDIGRLSGYNFTGRVYGLPVKSDDGRRLLHVAFALRRGPREPSIPTRFRQRPETHLAPYFISTGKLALQSSTIASIEGAFVYDSFSLQGEYKPAWMTTEDGINPSYLGWYLYGSYWITGEHRAYRNGVFRRVTVKSPFLEGGPGGWEVGLRYSMLDLGSDAKPEDSAIPGDRLDDITVGVNWHWNKMTRMMFNVIHATIDQEATIWTFSWRGQVEF
jgi:phosphate-selective porin OprO/OprP